MVDERYELIFDLRKGGWVGVLRIKDKQTNPWETMAKYQAVIDGTDLSNGNVISFKISMADNGWKNVDATLKVSNPGIGLGNIHIKDNGVKLVDVPLKQKKL